MATSLTLGKQFTVSDEIQRLRESADFWRKVAFEGRPEQETDLAMQNVIWSQVNSDGAVKVINRWKEIADKFANACIIDGCLVVGEADKGELTDAYNEWLFEYDKKEKNV
jgi:hypothetical protein